MNATDLRGLAIAGTLAQNAEPYKATIDTLPDGCVMEPKYDGWRILAFVGDGHVDLFARSGNTYNGRLPHVETELLAKFPPGTVLDGEAAALTVEDGKVTTWGTVQSVMTTHGQHAAAEKVSYMVFDLLAHGNIDARSLAYADRRALLVRIFADPGFDCVCLSPVLDATTETYEALVTQGFEGGVVKRLSARYASGKREGAGWLKLKPRTTIDAIVIGFKEGQEGFSGLVGAVVFGQTDPATGQVVERGRCSGFDMRTRLDMTNHPEKWLGRVIEVAHEGVDIGGNGTDRFRFPQMKRVRKDKAPEQVVLHDA